MSALFVVPCLGTPLPGQLLTSSLASRKTNSTRCLCRRQSCSCSITPQKKVVRFSISACFQARLCCPNEGCSSTGAPGAEEVLFAPTKLVCNEMQHGAENAHIWNYRNCLGKNHKGTEFTALSHSQDADLLWGTQTPSKQEVEESGSRLPLPACWDP